MACSGVLLKSRSALFLPRTHKSYISRETSQINMVLVSIRLPPLEKSLNKETESVYLAPSITPPLFWFRQLARKKVALVIILLSDYSVLHFFSVVLLKIVYKSYKRNVFKIYLTFAFDRYVFMLDSYAHHFAPFGASSGTLHLSNKVTVV